MAKWRERARELVDTHLFRKQKSAASTPREPSQADGGGRDMEAARTAAMSISMLSPSSSSSSSSHLSPSYRSSLSTLIKTEMEALLSRPPVIELDWGRGRLIDCGICHSHLSLERATRLPCGHRFHPSCISEWADVSSSSSSSSSNSSYGSGGELHDPPPPPPPPTCPMCRDVLVYAECGHRLRTFFTVNVKLRYNEFDGLCRPCAPTVQAQEQLMQKPALTDNDDDDDDDTLKKRGGGPGGAGCYRWEGEDGQENNDDDDDDVEDWQRQLDPDILRCRATVVQAILEGGVEDLLESLWCRLHDAELRHVLIGPVAEDLMRVAKALEILRFYEARPDVRRLPAAQREVRLLIDNWGRYLMVAARGVCGLMMLNVSRRSW